MKIHKFESHGHCLDLETPMPPFPYKWLLPIFNRVKTAEGTLRVYSLARASNGGFPGGFLVHSTLNLTIPNAIMGCHFALP